MLRDDSVAPRAGIPPPPDVAAPPADAQMRASGVAIKMLRAGIGEERPWSRDRVTVHYTGWTTDGKMFDSSVERGKPITFGLTDVIVVVDDGEVLVTTAAGAQLVGKLSGAVNQ